MATTYRFVDNRNKQARQTKDGSWELRYKTHGKWGHWIPNPSLGEPKGLKK